ncbi:hypothetical protein DE146DRAFT_793205 [Phaeosphaeria sp. MPI-PUGE-AT-0046c]|nr:hypothetical protein DE146DRAFT_793205 [Phaeosphaeria sp. MPI-PUGE-AT-0046c]
MTSDNIEAAVDEARKTSSSHQTATLIGLATELRLQIYESLPIHTFVQKSDMLTGNPQSYEFSIFTRGVTVTILATCRQIHAAASAIMEKKMEDIIQTPLRLL